MEDNDKTKKQLINELIKMRRKVAELEVIKNGHKRIEKALKESEERYRSLFKASTEGILIADIETMRLKYANSALSKMLGYSEEELKAMNIKSIHPKDALNHVISEIKSQIKGEKRLAREVPCLRKDGKMLYADINATKVLINGKECFLEFFMDITYRKNTEEALEKSVIATIEMVEDIAERKRTEEELKKAKGFAESAKLKLEKLNRQLGEANRKLQGLTFIDGLTGIANRRLFDQVLDKEWRRALRNQEPLSLIMIDIDYFKNYNDSYGHLKGDDCLRLIAKTLTSVARRPGDLVSRYGGEEFAVILPDTASENASKLAEKARTDILSQKIPHDLSPIFDYVTISLGVASIIPTNDLQTQRLIEAADKSLYQAKHEGRNRVIIFDEMNK